MFFPLQAKVEVWKQQCLDLDVVVKEGHLMLQQESSGQAVAFDEKLGNLNMEWHTVIQVGLTRYALCWGSLLSSSKNVLRIWLFI